MSENEYAELLPALDVPDGLSRVMNNKKVFCRLLPKFKGREMTDTLAAALTAGDFTQIAQAAHALKGTAANLGLKQLYEITADIEGKAKASADASSRLPDLAPAIDAAEAAIQKFLTREGSV
jgi:HPt (histidine-containing phosphotransfer) domain-containing protein